MQEVLLNYYIRIMLAENLKEMVKQANLKQINFIITVDQKIASFVSIEINLDFFSGAIKKQIWSNKYCHLDPPCEYVELQ